MAADITCPACGKKNEGVVECVRCGCELAILQRITEASLTALLEGQKCLERGQSAAAGDQARNSWHLKKSPEAARLAFLANLAMGDFTQAEKWYAVSMDK
jgi:hypothetical protein